MRMALLAAVIMFAGDAYAATAFEAVFGGSDMDRGVFASPTRDGGYVALGVTKSSGEGGEDVYFVRTDSEGELLWSRTYGGPGEDNGWAIHETPDGFVLAGFTESFGNGGFDFYLLKTAPDGELQWSKTYGGERDDRCWALAPTTDGSLLLVGETKSSGAGEEDFFVVKVDSLGTELWSRTYGGEKGDRCFSVAKTDDGGYILAGQTYSEGAGDRDAYLIKTNSVGEPEWSKTFGGEASDVSHSIERVADGNFVVTGYTTSFATVGDDPYLIKIDAQGNTQWTQVIPLAGVSHTITGAQATDGGFFLVGFTEYPEKWANAALLVKTDSDGVLDWHRDVFLTNQGRSLAYTVRATSDGGCVFTGHTTTKGAGNLDLILMKISGEKP